MNKIYQIYFNDIGICSTIYVDTLCSKVLNFNPLELEKHCEWGIPLVYSDLEYPESHKKILLVFENKK